MKINKAWLTIIYFVSLVAFWWELDWIIDYAYNPKHPAWVFWVLPLQKGLFIITILINLIAVILMTFPLDSFIEWAEKKAKEIKSR